MDDVELRDARPIKKCCKLDLCGKERALIYEILELNVGI